MTWTHRRVARRRHTVGERVRGRWASGPGITSRRCWSIRPTASTRGSGRRSSGAVEVPLNPQHRGELLHQLAGDASARILVVDAATLGELDLGDLGELVETVVVHGAEEPADSSRAGAGSSVDRPLLETAPDHRATASIRVLRHRDDHLHVGHHRAVEGRHRSVGVGLPAGVVGSGRTRTGKAKGVFCPHADVSLGRQVRVHEQPGSSIAVRLPRKVQRLGLSRRRAANATVWPGTSWVRCCRS